MTRKTIEVGKLLKWTNLYLGRGGDFPVDQQERHGMIRLLELTLHETGNYKGYGYLAEDDVPNGAKPGIRMRNECWEEGEEYLRFTDTDETRRYYYP
jgi:hypothetical protein